MNTGDVTTAGSELFNYEGVKQCIDKLDAKFEEFAELLRSANDHMNDEIAVNDDSALYGTLGTKFLDDWNENASTFGDFYENFSVWSQLMVNVMNQYADYEDATVKDSLRLASGLGNASGESVSTQGGYGSGASVSVSSQGSSTTSSTTVNAAPKVTTELNTVAAQNNTGTVDDSSRVVSDPIERLDVQTVTDGTVVTNGEEETVEVIIPDGDNTGDLATGGGTKTQIGGMVEEGLAGVTDYLTQNGLPPETWSDTAAQAGLLVGGSAGALVGRVAGHLISNGDASLNYANVGAAAGYLLVGVPTAIGGSIVGKTLEGYATGQIAIPFVNNEYYGTVIQDFTSNFDYSNCTSLEAAAQATASGLYNNMPVFKELATNVVQDTVQATVDVANYSIFNRNDGYWESLGNDLSQNLNFSNSSSLSDAVILGASGVADTFWGPEGAPKSEIFDFRNAATSFFNYWG